MLTTIKGIYDNNHIILEEQAPVSTKTNVIVTFLGEEVEMKRVKRIPGGLKGKLSIPDNFDEPLDDLKNYM